MCVREKLLKVCSNDDSQNSNTNNFKKIKYQLRVIFTLGYTCRCRKKYRVVYNLLLGQRQQLLLLLQNYDTLIFSVEVSCVSRGFHTK